MKIDRPLNKYITYSDYIDEELARYKYFVVHSIRMDRTDVLIFSDFYNAKEYVDGILYRTIDSYEFSIYGVVDIDIDSNPLNTFLYEGSRD